MRASAASLLVVAFLAVAPGSAATLSSQTLSRPEGERQYLVATPTVATPGRRALVIVLHGHGGSAAKVLGQKRSKAPLSLWLSIADREDIVVLAPDGTQAADHQAGWNDCRQDSQDLPHTDDVGFIRALLDEAIPRYNVDPQRVYVTGMSNGGMMSYRLAIALGPRIAAFAAVSASMAADDSCAAPSTPMSVLILSGTADPLVPYGGGQVGFANRRSRGTVLPVEEAARRWRELDKLPATPSSVRELPHRLPGDLTRVTRTVWGADPAGLQVELLRVEGGGHVEPSVGQRLGALYLKLVGPQNADLETAEEAWAFFREKRARP